MYTVKYNFYIVKILVANEKIHKRLLTLTHRLKRLLN